MERLANLETMALAEIEGPDHHRVPVERIVPDAQRQLEQIGQDDVDGLLSFHLTGRQRIWGIPREHVVCLLWWDPQHRVCPSLRGR